MDELIKVYLDKMHQSIEELHNINKLQINNVNEKISELKDVIEKINEKVEKMQIDYPDEDYVKDIKKDLEEKIEKIECTNIEALSSKKIYVVCGIISSVCISIAEIIDKIFTK